MSLLAQSAPHTWDEFVALDEEDLRELIDGELVEVEVPTDTHQSIVGRIGSALTVWSDRGVRGANLGLGIQGSRLHQNFYYQRREGLLDKRSFDAPAEALRVFLAEQNLAALADHAPLFQAEFAAHMNDIIDRKARRRASSPLEEGTNQEVMLLLQMGPDLPGNVTLDAIGIPYADDVARSDEPLPDRFGGPARPDDPEGPPWSTLVFGLETGRFGLRDRFLVALRADADAGRSLVRYGDALESAFRELFGGRGATADAPSFLAFVRKAVNQFTSPAREQLARGVRELPQRHLDERISQLGAAAFSFGTETGHVPADHPEVMYWLSSLAPELRDAHFTQVVEGDGEEPTSYVLEAWCNGQAIRAPARALGDYVDPWSCAGLVNAVLRDVVSAKVRVFLECEDDGARAVVGTPEVIRRLRAEGILASEDESDD